MKSESEIAGYLAEIFEVAGNDPAVIAAALGDAAKAFGMVKLARETGLTREGPYKALSKDGNPSFGTVLKVARARRETYGTGGIVLSIRRNVGT